jgi:hypothetical protein
VVGKGEKRVRILMERRRMMIGNDKCKRQFPECPIEMNETCHTCPFFNKKKVK